MPDVEFFINFEDGPRIQRSLGQPLPVMSWSTTPSHMDILIPYQFNFADPPGSGAPAFPATPEDVDSSFDSEAWSERKDVAVWRGVTTGEALNTLALMVYRTICSQICCRT